MGKLTVGLGVTRGNPAVFELVSAVVRGLPYDYTVISWHRPGSIVAGSGTTSMHSTGDAIDIRVKGARLIPGSPCGGMTLDAASMQKMDALHRALEAVPHSGDGPLWRTCVGGNHWDHDHFGHRGPVPKGLENIEAVESEGGAGGLLGAVGNAIEFGSIFGLVIIAVALMAATFALYIYGRKVA